MFKITIKGAKSRKSSISTMKTVKHSKTPAKTNAKHGTVILKGKIIEEYDLPKAK